MSTHISSGKDEVKGRVKEAVGDLTGNDKTKAEGQKDQASAKVKEAAENARDTVERVADKAKDKVVDLVDGVKERAK